MNKLIPINTFWSVAHDSEGVLLIFGYLDSFNEKAKFLIIANEKRPILKIDYGKKIVYI